MDFIVVGRYETDIYCCFYRLSDSGSDSQTGRYSLKYGFFFNIMASCYESRENMVPS